MDKNFKIRGYSKSDYDVGFLKVAEDKFQEINKNTIVNFLENAPKEKIPSEFWPVISKINGIRSIEEIIKSSKKDSKVVLKTLIELRSMNLISFDIVLDDYDIPVITEEGLNFLLNPEKHFNEKTNLVDDEKTFSTLKALLDENKFEIIKSIDSKSSIITLAESNSISLSNMKSILKFLQKNEYIKLLPKELKLCLIFEKVYASFTQSIDNFLGNKGIKIFKGVLEKSENPIIKLIKFSEDNEPSFESVRINIESQKDLNTDDLEQIFLFPMLHTIEKVKPALNLLSSNYIVEFKTRIYDIFENLKDMFGFKNMHQLEKLL